ncbi:metallophosphoesterase [Microbacterium phage PauloDiaboli]|nr:metallophosphoesterase [Microbacterium phage PauloDiaboli]
MAKVRIYEDIDGCLNADWNAVKWRQEGDEEHAGRLSEYVMPEFDDFGQKKEENVPAGWGNYRTFKGFKMIWNSRLIDALNSLENVEWVWTTTWREDALKVGTAMKLLHEPQRVLHPLDGKTEFPSIHWKYEAIVAEQEKDPSPFIAVDDEWSQVHREVSANLRNLGGLVISPSFNFGLEPSHIEQMREYIAKHS